MTAGAPAPGSNLESYNSWPTTASGRLVKFSDDDSPSVFRLPMPTRNSTASSTVVPIQRGRSLLPTWAAILPHRPCVVRSAASSTFGFRGQNTHRPAADNATGRNVIITRYVHAMPIAATGPRLLLEFSSENIRHSRPRMTVTADAVMVGADSFHALIMASNRLG